MLSLLQRLSTNIGWKCMELARARGDLAEIYSTSARY